MKKTIGIFFIFLAVYLLTISRVPSISNDSINYISAVDSGEMFFHPHHLLYHVFALGFFKLLLMLNLSSDSVVGVAALNSIFGALSIALIFNLLTKQLKFDELNAFLVASIIGFSFGFWFYSCCVEVYIIPLFLIMLGYYLYFEFKHERSGIWCISLCFASAILFHQVYALLLIVLWVILWIDKPSRKWGNFLISGLALPTVPAVTYFLIMRFRYGLSSPTEMYSWMTLYGHRMAYLWYAPSLNTIPMDLFGFFKSIFSIHPIFKSKFFLDIFNNYGRNHFIEDDIFLVRELNPSFYYIYLILTVLTALLLSYLVISNLKKIKQNFRNHRIEILSILVFQVVFTIFFSLWDSTNLEFWIPQSLFFWVLIFVLTRNESRFRQNTFIAVTLLFLMLFTNWYSTMRFVDKIDNDYYYHVVRETEKHANRGDKIIFGEGWIIMDYYKKFSDLEAFSIANLNEKNKLTQLEIELKNSQNGAGIIVESDFDNYLKINAPKDFYQFWNDLEKNSTEQSFSVRDRKFIKMMPKN